MNSTSLHPPPRRKVGANKCPVEEESPLVHIFIVAYEEKKEFRKEKEGGKERKTCVVPGS